MFLSSIEERTRLISKGMPHIYYYEKLMFSKLRFWLFSEKKMKKCTSFEQQKGTSLFGETFIFALLSSKQSCINWLHSYNENLPKHIDLKLKFQKTENWFCWWKSNDYNDINTFLSLENLWVFLLVTEKTWKSIFNTNT